MMGFNDFEWERKSSLKELQKKRFISDLFYLLDTVRFWGADDDNFLKVIFDFAMTFELPKFTNDKDDILDTLSVFNGLMAYIPTFIKMRQALDVFQLVMAAVESHNPRILVFLSIISKWQLIRIKKNKILHK